MQLAAILVMSIQALVYLIRSAQGIPTLRDLVLVASVMWPVTAAFYLPLLDIRNPLWVTLGLMSIWWLIGCQRPIISRVWPLLVFLGYMMTASLWAVNSMDSATRTIGCILMMIYVVVQIWTRPSEQVISRIFNVLVLVSLGILLLLAWIVSQKGISLSQRFQMPEAGLRATGIASFALTALIVLCGRGFKEKGVRRLLLWGLAGISLTLMVLTKTRGTLFALIGVVGFLIVFLEKTQHRTWNVFLYLVTLFLLALITFMPDAMEKHWDSVLTYFRLEAATTSFDDAIESTGRLDLWTYALEKARERPYLGRGTGSSTFAMVPDQIFASGSIAGFPIVTVHSQYVETYYDHGLVGLGLLIIILIWITWAAIKAFRNPPPGLETETRTLALLWITAPIGMVSHGGYFSSGNPHQMWVWLAGLAMVYVQQHAAERHEQVVPAPLQLGYRKFDAKVLHNQTGRRI